MSKYIPIDLGFEQYTKLDDSLNAKEYGKILAMRDRAVRF